MARIPRSFADVIRDWEQLLGAANDSPELLAIAGPLRDALVATLAEARQVKLEQEACAADRQRATQQLRETVFRGFDEARKVRGMAKGLLGPANEALVRFGVAPLRRRGRRSPIEPPTIPPVGDRAVDTV